MPFQIVRNNIVSMQVDAIVNPTDSHYSGSGGTDKAIHDAAGKALGEACRLLPPLATGKTAVTSGFGLPCRYIIHTVGPVWRGGAYQEEQALVSCYQLSLEEAFRLQCESIAIPLISSGTFGFPKDRVLRIALDAIGSFLLSHDMNVWIVVYDKDSYSISRKLLADIDAFIDDEYIDLHTPSPYHHPFTELNRRYTSSALESPAEFAQDLSSDSFWDDDDVFSEASSDSLYDGAAAPPYDSNQWGFVDNAPAPQAPYADTFFEKADTSFKQADKKSSGHTILQPPPPPPVYSVTGREDLSTLFQELDEGFSGSLLKLIDKSGLSDVECYKRANIDKRLFSKIRSNPDYHPSKQTALAFAIALHLSVEETQKLLETAGLTLSRSSKFDVIIKYFLSQKQYDIYEINEVLYRYDQPCLGNVML